MTVPGRWPRNKQISKTLEDAECAHCRKRRWVSCSTSSAAHDNGAEKENLNVDKDVDDQILRCISRSAEVRKFLKT